MKQHHRSDETASHASHAAFTLVELLVVVTIIVTLLAILLPALNRSIAAAQMAVDGSNLRQIATGANTYAGDHRAAYPSRDAQPAGPGWGAHYKPTIVCKGEDDRPKLAPYMPFSQIGNCPLSPAQLDFGGAPATHQVEIDYALYFGHKLEPNDPGMMRVGGEMRYDGERFRVLASDWETIDVSYPFIESSHNAGSAHASISQGDPQPYWIDRWDLNAAQRPPVDLNFAYTDCSVEAIHDLTTDDERVRPVPSARYDNPTVRWTQLPVGP